MAHSLPLGFLSASPPPSGDSGDIYGPITYDGCILPWLSGVVVRAPDSRSTDRGFDSRLRHCRATTLGKLFSPMCLCLPSSISWYLARAFMSTCRMWQPCHGSSEPGEYCSKRFSSDVDRLEPLYKFSTLLYFYHVLRL